MAHDDRDLDRWLSDDDAIVPSSGFTATVMDAVAREALQPPAIPFPWTRALPGLAVALAATAVGAYLIASMSFPASTGSGAWLDAPLALMVRSATSDEAGWMALAAVVTVVPVLLSLRLTRARRLF